MTTVHRSRSVTRSLGDEAAAERYPWTGVRVRSASDVRVVWHPEAILEREAIPDARERTALRHAVDKLVAEGNHLRFPHQSAVQRSGMRELRPRAGSSPWRAIYRQYDERTMIVLAIGPEAVVDRRRFDGAVRAAGSRLAELEP